MIIVRLFAVLKDRAGRDLLHVEPGPKSVGELLGLIAREHPSLADMIASGRLLVSVNMEFADREAPVKDGDEVALMPPFSGGIAEPRTDTKSEVD